MRTLVALIFAASLPAQPVRNPRTSAEDIALGAKTFRSHCAPCHGMHAEGGRGPNLASGRFYHGSSDANLLTNITEGIPGTEMPALFYMEDRVWQIIAYIRSLNAAAERPAGDVARGAALFHSKGCSGCHRVGREGGSLGRPHACRQNPLISIFANPSSISADVQPHTGWRASKTTPCQSGFVMNEDTYSVRLMDMNQQLHSSKKAAAQLQVESQDAVVQDSLTGEPLNDLVAYLASLRRNEAVMKMQRLQSCLAAICFAVLVRRQVTYERLLNAGKEPATG
jgi:mono/diheme cytochrome c family protein